MRFTLFVDNFITFLDTQPHQHRLVCPRTTLDREATRPPFSGRIRDHTLCVCTTPFGVPNDTSGLISYFSEVSGPSWDGEFDGRVVRPK